MVPPALSALPPSPAGRSCKYRAIQPVLSPGARDPYIWGLDFLLVIGKDPIYDRGSETGGAKESSDGVGA
jgi:hypothetical protein